MRKHEKSGCFYVVRIGGIICTIIWLACACASAQQTTSSAMLEDLKSSGSITGTVKWKGPLPEFEEFRIEVDRLYCARKGLRENVPVEIDPNDLAIGSVVVYAESSAIPRDPQFNTSATLRAELELTECNFSTRTLLMIPAQKLRVTNADSIVHDITVSDGNKRVIQAEGLASRGQRAELGRFSPGVYELRCRRHPWERCSIFVPRHKHYTMTDAKGKFELSELPPGGYTLRAWHPGWGASAVKRNGLVVNYDFTEPYETTARLLVRSGRATSVELEFKPHRRP